MHHRLKKIFILIIYLYLFISIVEVKSAIRRIDKSNYQQFIKHNSYWILQISQQNCPECLNQQKQLTQAAQLLQGVCKFGKVDTKFLQGMKLSNNPSYVFLRSNKFQENVEYTENKITKTALAKFCLSQIQKAVKKRYKALFGNQKLNSDSSRLSKQNKKTEKKYDTSKVIELTDNQFQKAVLKSKQAWFVQFYSPSCGHCKNLQPEYNNLPALIGKTVHIAKIDATVYRKYASKYQIKGYPTLLLFEYNNKQNPLPYQGQRNAQDIKNWLDQKKIFKAVKQFHQLNKKSYEWNCNKNIVCLIFILDNKSQKSKLKYIKLILQQTIQKPIQFFYSERLLNLESNLMIQDRSTPKMVALWEGISSYRIYNGANDYQDLNKFITNLMQRKQWIKLQKKSMDLLFNENKQL